MRKTPLARKPTSKPEELAYSERCPDCEYNGYLNNFGEPVKGTPIGSCKGCGGRGRIRLLTVDDLRKATDDTRAKMFQRLSLGRARLVRPSELIDPYLVKAKKK